MTKFILGLLVGLIAGYFVLPYLNGPNMNTLVHQARSTLGRHVPINN